MSQNEIAISVNRNLFSLMSRPPGLTLRRALRFGRLSRFVNPTKFRVLDELVREFPLWKYVFIILFAFLPGNQTVQGALDSSYMALTDMGVFQYDCST